MSTKVIIIVPIPVIVLSTRNIFIKKAANLGWPQGEEPVVMCNCAVSSDVRLPWALPKGAEPRAPPLMSHHIWKRGNVFFESEPEELMQSNANDQST